MSADKPQRLISDMRGVRYGEVLAVMSRDEKLQADVYGTQMINDCPAELWDTLNADEIAKDMGALFVKLNGPRYWMLDGLGTKVAFVEPVMREGGLDPRRKFWLGHAQRQAIEHAEAALRKLAAQAHGEVLTQLLTAWEQRDASQLPTAQALGSRVNAATRSAWSQSLNGGAPAAVPADALLRLEMAAEVPTPAELLDTRRMLQLQLLTRRHAAAPVDTWVDDVASVLASGFDAGAERRLQNVLKVLLKR